MDLVWIFNVHFMLRCVDMMLLLFAFPTEMGHPTKPNGGKGVQIGNWAESEPFVFPFW